MLNRQFAREVSALVADPATRQRLVRRTAAFAHLHAMHLRDVDDPARAAPWLPAAEFAALEGLRGKADAVLRAQTADLAQLRAQGAISDILYTHLAHPLAELSLAQASCERLRNTPIPFAYSLLLHRTAWLFCLLMPFGFVGTLGFGTPLISAILAYTLFGLDALGDELEEPFGLEMNDLALDAMVRVIEIDLLEALGEPERPAPLQPENYVLR